MIWILDLMKRRFDRMSAGLALVALILIAARPALAAPANSPWNASYFPNVSLVDQNGRKVRFYDDLIRGKVVAINFFFSRCSDVCPAETANLRRVEKILGDRVGKDVHFYSISIDPKFDTPARLRQYAAKFNAGPKWSFLAGKVSDVNLLRRKLGLLGTDRDDAKKEKHTVSFIVGNEAKGLWIKRSAFDHPKILARLLGDTLQPMPDASFRGLTYEQAQRLPNLSKGEDLFRSRCASCHSLGMDDGIGPGLAGVTGRRDRAWLARWIQDPEKMLAEGDSLARALFVQYKEVRMPKLDLSDSDVKSILEFVDRFQAAPGTVSQAQ